MRKTSPLVLVVTLVLVQAALAVEQSKTPSHSLQHPRLYFTAADLQQLRAKRKTSEAAARVWANLTKSADWCAKQKPRDEWIPTLEKDPQFENLYDRFYAAMHDA